ncbi:MAG: response regulator transcription factor [Planctomycetota bacterium]|nr:response regulator transcription factor [Planctomycetota bacterium]
MTQPDTDRQVQDAAKPRIQIIGEHSVARLGFRILLERDGNFEVCGESGAGPQALEDADLWQPELAIVDISLGNGMGIDLVRELKRRQPAIKIVVTSMHEESLYAGLALHAGAAGYVNKRLSPEEVAHAVRTVNSGRIYLSPHITQQMLAISGSTDSPGPGDPLARLTHREIEVFELTGKGWTTRRIAAQLSISVHTVESYRERIRQKLKIRSSADLAFRATVWTLMNQ